ncbi:MAG: hypothetical protein ABIA12_00120 [Candidatus Aenigmatarchaeota archaeon]
MFGTKMLGHRSGFPKCPVCRRTISSNSDAQIGKNGKVAKRNYCRLCGMETWRGKEFCCESCEYKFERFVRSGRRKPNN